ncbi:MAG: hypothetical protein NZ840_09335 [Anaerolineales bacterium]|nr:hypothetical protein [Anaerolineales bacterium]MDW8162243.1 hypothetical protein [Anaerolineales bacterium]
MKAQIPEPSLLSRLLMVGLGGIAAMVSFAVSYFLRSAIFYFSSWVADRSEDFLIGGLILGGMLALGLPISGGLSGWVGGSVGGFLIQSRWLVQKGWLRGWVFAWALGGAIIELAWSEDRSYTSLSFETVLGWVGLGIFMGGIFPTLFPPPPRQPLH